MSRHRDFVRDEPSNRRQVRIGRVEGEDAVLEWAGLDDFDGRTVFITDVHEQDACPFAEHEYLPLLRSSEPFTIPDVAAVSPLTDTPEEHQT